MFLVPLANTIDKLSAYCMECKDGTLAHFTKRTLNSTNQQEMVGAGDIYMAVCRKHIKDEVDEVILEYIKESL
jgi:thymidine kinase